jgi:hypothetical protein
MSKINKSNIKKEVSVTSAAVSTAVQEDDGKNKEGTPW